MPTESLNDMIARLSASAHALAALGLAIEARAGGEPLPASLAPHVEAVAAALGAGELIDAQAPSNLVPLLGEVRTFTLANAKLLVGSSWSSGWTHGEAELLEAAGEVSVGVPRRIEAAIAPRLPGLSERLSAPDAAFLDVGVGVAAMAVEMARTWPGLRVVGIDPLPQALALARRRVEAAGLGDRIELREGRGEDLTDLDRFDLAWVPSLFIPEAAIPALLGRVHAALRPGGWLLFPTIKPTDDPLATALSRLRVASFGGLVATPERTEGLLRGAGFGSVSMLPASPIATGAMMVGQKAPA